MQLGAMQRDVGGAEAPLDLGPHGMRIGDLARVPLAIVAELRRKADAADALFEPEPAQDLHRIGIHLNPGADARECLVLLVNLRPQADLAQRGGGREPGYAGADDGYRRCCSRHRAFPIDHASGGRPCFSRSARSTASGVSGNSVRRTPTASSMALATAGDRQSVADSPAPFAPNGPLC